jgi:DNA repair exonuclease SbcCD ATPase subunit
MTRAEKGWIILVVATVGVWGCSQGQSTKTSSRHEERIKALEAKCDHLESEYQSAVNERDLAQKKATDLAKEKTRLLKELEDHRRVLTERDELKIQVVNRTSERDAYVGQLEELRKGIRSLLTRVESALPSGNDKGEKTSMLPKS